MGAPVAKLRSDQPDGVAMIVGLGNPGVQYGSTRHNIGFMAIERLAEREHFAVQRRFRRALTGSWTTGTGAILVAKPQTFMNASGESVAAIARFYQLQPSNLLVVCDDVSLPFGRIRVRTSGSEAGHNGLRSISQQLGSREYARLRVGIGKPPERWEMIDYVLAPFSRNEQAELPAILDRVVDAMEVVISDGFAATMSRFNGE